MIPLLLTLLPLVVGAPPERAPAGADPVVEAQGIVGRLDRLDPVLASLGSAPTGYPAGASQGPRFDWRLEAARSREAVGEYRKVARDLLEAIRAASEKHDASQIRDDLKRLRLLLEAGERLVDEARRYASAARD